MCIDALLYRYNMKIKLKDICLTVWLQSLNLWVNEWILKPVLTLSILLYQNHMFIRYDYLLPFMVLNLLYAKVNKNYLHKFRNSPKCALSMQFHNFYLNIQSYKTQPDTTKQCTIHKSKIMKRAISLYTTNYTLVHKLKFISGFQIIWIGHSLVWFIIYVIYSVQFVFILYCVILCSS